MPDTTSGEPKVALGVGSLIGESFSILFGKFVPVVTVAFVPSLIGLLITGMLVGFEYALGIPPITPEYVGPWPDVLSALIDIVENAIITGLLVQLAYDAKLGHRVQLRRYFDPALSALLPLIVLSFVSSFLIGFASLALLIPGLWVYAMYSVMPPAVVIERTGFRGLGRSEMLSKEYRWPIAGALVLALIFSALIDYAATFIVGLVAATDLPSFILGMLLYAAFSAIGASLVSILIALIYARLREIKEGISVDEIASVFD